MGDHDSVFPTIANVKCPIYANECSYPLYSAVENKNVTSIDLVQLWHLCHEFITSPCKVITFLPQNSGLYINVCEWRSPNGNPPL